MIPAEDDTIDIEKIIFDCLSDRFGHNWCVLSGNDLDLAYAGSMFVIYDSLKEKSIVCFKPDIRRGKYKQVSIAEEEPDEKLPLTVLENSMDDALYRESLNIIQRELQREYDKHADSQYACAIRTSLNQSNKGLYQVVVGEDCEVKHYLDSRATNVLYVEAGAFHVLIWKLSVTEDMVNMSRAHKSERAGVDFLFVSALFFIMMGVFYVTYLLLKSGYMCREEHICDEAFEDKLLDYRSLFFKGLILLAFFYYFYLTYRNLQRKRRHTQDVEHFEKLTFGDKTD